MRNFLWFLHLLIRPITQEYVLMSHIIQRCLICLNLRFQRIRWAHMDRYLVDILDLSEAFWGARMGNCDIKLHIWGQGRHLEYINESNQGRKMKNDFGCDSIWTPDCLVKVQTANHYTKGDCCIMHSIFQWVVLQ